MNALTKLLNVHSLPERPKATATHKPSVVEEVLLDVEGAHHGQTFNFRYGEVTADHLKRGISIIVPPLTGHPALPKEGIIILALSFDSEQWQFSTEVVDGIYEGEKLFIAPEQLAPFAGQVMAADLYVFELGIGVPLIWITTFFELALPNHMARMEGAINSVIDAQVAARGSVLLIPPYDGMKYGDDVMIYLLGQQSEGSHVFRVTVEQSAVGQAISVPVPAKLLQPSGNSTITVFYRVVAADGTKQGPLGTFFVERDSGALVVADAAFTGPRLFSELSEETRVLFTVPQSVGQQAGADQTLFLWEEMGSPRRDYLLETRSLDGPTKWSSAFFPKFSGNSVFTTTWITAGAVWAAEVDQVTITRMDSPLHGSLPDRPPALVEPGSLEAPTVLEAIEGGVTEEAISAGLTVSAPRPAHLPNGSYLSLLLKG